MVIENGILQGLWGEYAKAGYEKAYWTHSTRKLRDVMEELFLETNGGKIIDAGCGTGDIFETAIRKINPEEIQAVDWSEEMLAKARRRAQRLLEIPTVSNDSINGVVFKFKTVDLSKPLPWPDGEFHAFICNLVICYLQGGWQEPIREFYRVIRQGGYLYLSTFLEEWDNFPTALSRFALMEIIRSPIGVFYGIRFRKIAAEIVEETKKRGAEFPAQDELIKFLETLGFKEIKTLPVFWGFGLALRARKT